MADNKPKDKELSTNAEVKRSDDFQGRINTQEKVIESVKKLLDSTTEDAFSKLGYERVEKKAGVYGTGKEYGSGSKEHRYQIRIAGKTSSSLEKQIMFGAKRLQSDINIDYKENVAVIDYKTTEAGAFRGANKDSKYTGAGKALMVNEKATIPTKNMKEFDKKLKEMFEDAAKREIAFLTSTKLGVEDRLDAGTTSIVNENKTITEMDMKKLSLKDILFGDEEFGMLDESKSPNENIEKVKSANSIPLKDIKPKAKDADKDKHLFFDANKKSESKKVEETAKKHKSIAERSKEIDEMTAAGPAGAGAGAFLTPYAFKNTPYFKNRKSKRPKVDENYNVIPETKDYLGLNSEANQKGNKDGFWSVVKVDPDYHPQGMPFVKPGSKEEWDNTIHGDKNKLSRMGLKEGGEKHAPPMHLDLTKKKIFSEEENKAKGINKRYLVTERTSDEYLKERWNRLSTFKTYETVKEAEEMNSLFEAIDNEEVIQQPLIQIAESFVQKPVSEGFSAFTKGDSSKDAELSIDEDTSHTISINEETVEVEKPSSEFGISHKFYKKDFLNEEKKYILDLNTMVFVPNPNAK